MTSSFVEFIFRRTRHATLFQVLIILAVGTLAYSNTFDAQFNFDDVSAILGNPVVRSTDPLADPSLVKGLRAVGDLSFALNYKFALGQTGNGFAVRGYHAVNLVIHLINALLVYSFVLATFLASPIFSKRAHSQDSSGAIAFFAALFFLSHPLQTQAVTYIVQRYTSLATMFYLASILLYIAARWLWGQNFRSRICSAVLCAATSLLAAVLAMKTKEIAFTLPLMVMVYEFVFFQGNLRKRMALIGACLVTLAIIPLSLIAASGGQFLNKIDALTKVQTSMPRLDYLFTQFRVIVTYLRLLVWPSGQNLDHDFEISHSFFNLPVLSSFLLLTVILSFGVYLIIRSKFEVRGSRLENEDLRPSTIDHRPLIADHRPPTTDRLIAFGIFWFFIALAVESSFIPIVDVMFEHRVYLPSVGFFIAAAALMVLAVDKLLLKRQQIAACLVAVIVLIPTVLAVLTFNRNMVWANEITLWQDAAAKSPDKSRVWNNLGSAYLKVRQPEKAIPALITSISLSPGHPDAWNNIGMALSQLGTYSGRFSPTYEMFDLQSGMNSIYQSEWFALAYNNLGLAYDSLGQIDESINNFKKSIDMNPRLAAARYNLALAYASAKDQQGLKEQFAILKTLNPQLAGKLLEAKHAAF